MERHEVVRTQDGNMEVFIACPDEPKKFAPILMYQNVGGFSELLKNMARRVAAEGYLCAVPDLYYRLGRIVIDPDSHDEETLAIRRVASGSMRNDRVMSDTAALMEFLRQDPSVRPGPMGTVGYCMGGRFCILAAETYPADVKATVSLFGTKLMTEEPDSPHLGLDRIGGYLYCGFAEHDRSMTLEQVERFRGLLDSACRADWEVEVHPGTEHGYAFPGRKVYHEAASEASWRKAFSIFERAL